MTALCHCLGLPLDFITDYTNEQIETLMWVCGFFCSVGLFLFVFLFEVFFFYNKP